MHHTQDRVILIGCVYSCEIGKGCMKCQYKSSNAMHEVVTKIWSVNVVACKTLTRISK